MTGHLLRKLYLNSQYRKGLVFYEREEPISDFNSVKKHLLPKHPEKLNEYIKKEKNSYLNNFNFKRSFSNLQFNRS